MNYPYSEVNRLQQPEYYMYSRFEGEALLTAHRSSRMALLETISTANAAAIDHDSGLAASALDVLEKRLSTRLDAVEIELRAPLKAAAGTAAAAIALSRDELVFMADGLEAIAIDSQTETADLLEALLAVQLLGASAFESKTWLDRLIQRFEVSKKLFDAYRPGFRKGLGSAAQLRLYWLFALLLGLAYTGSGNLKYLNTLLKICDLLCSLPLQTLLNELPGDGVRIVLVTEIACIRDLADSKGVSFAPE